MLKKSLSSFLIIKPFIKTTLIKGPSFLFSNVLNEHFEEMDYKRIA